MVQEYHIGDEPIPGYRLTKFLGRGGFGEVWQAIAPGRTEVALKIISLDRKQGMKEFRSLRLVKRIRHPNLVPILAFWLKDSSGNVLDDDSIDMLDSGLGEASARSASVLFNAARADQLVIAMGLGDMNLLALLQDYQTAGQAGIPAEELLDYMEGCARAIDYLNTARHDLGSGPVAIQHCDIKPQNIMIVGDAVQLCDFGLARSLTDVRSTSVAGSIAYGAPELFWENKPSGATDQYSLAISYYELRTGHLPFGLEMAQLEVMQAHRDGTLDFSHIDDGERAVLVRATAPSPAARFERTIDMVRALRRAIQSASHVEAIEPRPPGRSDLAGSALLESGREILPGYRLLEHLFHADSATDVWSASAPGAKPQSLWIYELSRAEGRPDLASLRMAQKFANPHLARLAEFWLLDESGGAQPLGPHLDQAALDSCRRVIAVSELTRTNLAHRLEECRESLGTGIPQPELLTYMRMAAEGVDALNAAWHPLDESRKASLLHRDLRPENLLLFHHDVKIGNLAWVRALESDATQLPESARRPTRIFSAPELARDRLTRWSDQYALAVCYAVMRTGNWMGNAPSGAIQPGRQPALDLAALPPPEAEVLAKALNARPEQRFADCRQMVAALDKASRAAPLAAPSTSAEAKPAAPWYGTIVAPSTEAAAAAPSCEVQLIEAGAAGSIADTSPETEARRSTIVEPFPAGAVPSARRRGRLGLALVATAAAVALAAGFLIGDDVRDDVEELAAQGQYEAALEAADQAGVWRRWRTDGLTLKRDVARKALAAAIAAPEAGRIGAACSIYARLAAIPDVLLVQDTIDFREKVLPRAIDLAEGQAAAGDFEQAGRIQRQLAAVLGDNVKVVELKEGILAQADQAARVCAKREDFKTAADICRQLEAIAPGSRQLDELRFELIRLGSEAVRAHRERDEFAAALQVYGQLEAAFPEDNGVRDIKSELIRSAIGAIETALQAKRLAEAEGVYRELAKLQSHDSKVERLGALLRELQSEGVRQLLDEGKWGGALTVFERISGDWPEASLDELQGQIIRAGIDEFDARSKAGQTEQAKEIQKRLAAAFPKDASVQNLRVSEPRGEMPQVVKLLDDADALINDGALDQAEANHRQVERLLQAGSTGEAPLRRRLLLAQAHISLLRKAWDEALSRLATIRPNELGNPDESAQRTRFYVLRALATARFDGGELAGDAKLDRIAEALQDVDRNASAWRQLAGQRVAISRFKSLIERLISRSGDLAFDSGDVQSSFAKTFLDRLDERDVEALSEAAQVQFWAVKTRLLLADSKTSWSALDQSLAKWQPAADRLPRDVLVRAASEIARWGVGSNEPEAIGHAADVLRGMQRQGDEIRREYVGLLIEQVSREAARSRPDWSRLIEQCREADAAAEGAGGHPRLAFVAACLAESLLETTTAESSASLKDARRQAGAIALAEVPAPDQPYVEYVQIIADADSPLDEPAITGDKLRRLFAKPSGVLDASVRRLRAAKLLAEAAGQVMGFDGAAAPDDLEPVAAEAADKAGAWLDVAAELVQRKPADGPTPDPQDASDQNGSLAKDLPLLRAAAAFYKTEPDLASAGVLSEQLIQAGRSEARVHLMSARAVEQTRPEQALLRYAAALEAVEIKPGSDRLETAYLQIVKPALALIGRVQTTDAPAKQAIARLFAAKGKLMLADGDVSAAIEQESRNPMSLEVFKAFEQALEYDPSVAAYYVERGMARSELPDCDLDKLKTEDLEPAARLFAGEPSASYFGLTGSLALRTGRTKAASGTIDERIKLYKDAIAAYQTAIQRCAPGDASQARFLVACSAANLELANYTDEPDDVIRVYLTEAQKLAGDATKIETRPHPEFAWRARGNAEEDFGWLLGDKDHYEEALAAFEQAISESPQGGSSPGKAWLGLGRARMRLALSGAQSGAQREKSLRRALEDLEAATHSSRLSSGDLAEAYYWQRDIHATLGQGADADRVAELALKNAPSPQARALYQYAWAASAPDARQKQDRARSILEDNPAMTHSMLGAQLVQLIAAGYLPSAPNSTDQQLLQALDQGLKEYARYFPWLSDAAKAGPEDAWALIYVSQHIISSPRFWRTNFETCKRTSERAVQLAEQQPSVALLAQARAARGGYRLFVSHSEASQRLSAAEKAAEDFKMLVELDDRLAAARLTARERRDLEKSSWLWRYLFAQAKFQIADDSGTSPERVAALCDEASGALDKVKHLPSVASLRKQIAALKRDRGR